MAVVAPLSRYKRNNFIIYIAVCLVGAAWFAYDGYFSEAFISKHTDADGQADLTLTLNRIAPPILLVAAAFFGGWFHLASKRKLVADDDGLTLPGKAKIPYDAIEKIDKTHFEAKGHFTIFYTRDGSETQLKLSDLQYAGLSEVLDVIVAKIT